MAASLAANLEWRFLRSDISQKSFSCHCQIYTHAGSKKPGVRGQKMIKKLPLFVGGQSSSDLINSGLSEFRWEELCDKEEIGRGRIGAVFTTKSRGEVVVIKKLFWQNACEKRLFLKEAKILKDQSHDHIVRVKGFCANPLAIISLFRSWTFWCEFLCQMSWVQAKFFTIDGSYFFL